MEPRSLLVDKKTRRGQLQTLVSGGFYCTICTFSGVIQAFNIHGRLTRATLLSFMITRLRRRHRNLHLFRIGRNNLLRIPALLQLSATSTMGNRESLSAVMTGSPKDDIPVCMTWQT